MKRQNIMGYPLVLICLFLIATISCEKDDINDSASSNPTNGKTTAIFNPNVPYGSMTDQDGNVYKTVTIGTQTWMAENLRTTKYNDGTAIPHITSNIDWSALSTGAYCNYNNTASIDTIATYGRLYNWFSVNTGKLAPVGWKVPTDAEMNTLSIYLGGGSVAGEKLKETGTTHWKSPNTGTTNETGFTALPGGFCDSNGEFVAMSGSGGLWSATESSSTYSFLWMMFYDDSHFYRSSYEKNIGFSVRCIKD